jgi:hypothetical protein
VRRPFEVAGADHVGGDLVELAVAGVAGLAQQPERFFPRGPVLRGEDADRLALHAAGDQFDRELRRPLVGSRRRLGQAFGVHQRDRPVDQQPGDDRVVLGRVALRPGVHDHAGEGRVSQRGCGPERGADRLSGHGGRPGPGHRERHPEEIVDPFAELNGAGVAEGRITGPGQAGENHRRLGRGDQAAHRPVDVPHAARPASRSGGGRWLRGRHAFDSGARRSRRRCR